MNPTFIIMKISSVKNKGGDHAGLFIPLEELSELKENLKETSKMRGFLDKLIEDWKHNNDILDTIMPEGRSIKQTNERSAKTVENLHREAFAKGLPMFYRDERCNKDNKEFIRANPDGSEDLVEYDFDSRSYTFVRHLLPEGKGYWSYILDKN